MLWWDIIEFNEESPIDNLDVKIIIDMTCDATVQLFVLNCSPPDGRNTPWMSVVLIFPGIGFKCVVCYLREVCYWHICWVWSSMMQHKPNRLCYHLFIPFYSWFRRVACKLDVDHMSFCDYTQCLTKQMVWLLVKYLLKKINCTLNHLIHTCYNTYFTKRLQRLQLVSVMFSLVTEICKPMETVFSDILLVKVYTSIRVILSIVLIVYKMAREIAGVSVYEVCWHFWMVHYTTNVMIPLYHNRNKSHFKYNSYIRHQIALSKYD